ncbi:phenylalanine--tRNA ligase subunit alpha [Spiroplasma chrysopicola]|uniref:Phenylalanine--tRNA ligase alpha subunit n=1 Tax=Spiroplasma chrysopicola DF-1 TaxID=1276227 RepID=R4UIV2_9MOLU|nr:phenylalanine--tRNA ligase subunit alpha [Spiroplasma chrysopicola]AGM25236.1 phenylalanyl-tRNA synthetase subunit alpha [Spiroplasma chrysopicola DF-1]
MEKQLNDLLTQAKNAITASTTLEQLNNLQVQYLGKKSVLNEFLKGMKDLPHEERLLVGQLANKIKGELTALWQATRKELELIELTTKLNAEKIDVTLPGFFINSAGRHPLMLVIEEITNIFNGLGYDVIFGPEVESDEFNFQKLNLPKDHPARDMQDTFYITESTLLRTHCTNMTARMLSQMQNAQEVIAVISAGNTYRRDDDDATHSHQFMQIDGFLVAPNISFANLKWTIQYFCERMFGENAKTRLRPSFFPFTEPSVEVDVTCIRCSGQGCSICKQTGWIEIMGAGMINPSVYEACGQSKDLTGFAFGIGIERIAMLKYGIDDIRRFYTNNIKFLEQFRNFN